jgi:hypothetical protein
MPSAADVAYAAHFEKKRRELLLEIVEGEISSSVKPLTEEIWS